MQTMIEDFGGDVLEMEFWQKFCRYEEDYTVCGQCGEEWLTGGCNCLMDYMTKKVDTINGLTKEIEK